MEHSSGDIFCGICQKVFNEPHQLPCGHTYCRVPCLLPSPQSSEAVCPECQIMVPASDLEIDQLALQRVVAFRQNNPSKVAVPKTCATCNHMVLNVYFCLHCHQRVCDACQGLHLNRLSSLMLTKVFGLKKSRRILQEENRTVVGKTSPLVDEVDKITVVFQTALDGALNRAEVKLDDIEVHHVHELLNAQDDLPNLVQMAASMSSQKADVIEGNCSELKLLKKQVNHIINSMNRIEMSILQSKKCEYFTVSKIFKTITYQIESLQLIKIDESSMNFDTNMLRSRNFQKRQNPFGAERAERKNMPSSSGSRKAASNSHNFQRFDKQKLFVGGLSGSITEDILKKHFGQFGSIQSVMISKGWAFVQFDDNASVLQAFDAAPHTIGSRRVEVRQFMRGGRSQSIRQPRPNNPRHASSQLQH